MVSEKKILPQNKKRLPWAVRLDTSELLGFIFSMLVSRAWNIGQPIMENLILVFGVVDDEQSFILSSSIELYLLPRFGLLQL